MDERSGAPRADGDPQDEAAQEAQRGSVANSGGASEQRRDDKPNEQAPHLREHPPVDAPVDDNASESESMAELGERGRSGDDTLQREAREGS